MAGAVLAVVPVAYIAMVVLFRTPLADELNSIMSGPIDEFAPIIFTGGMIASLAAFVWLTKSRDRKAAGSADERSPADPSI